jgi:DNA-binding LacI/PurR family transcriptional regulator
MPDGSPQTHKGFEQLYASKERFEDQLHTFELETDTYAVAAHMNYEINRRTDYLHLKPLFDQALEDTNVTVWVCYNDTIGLLAYTHLIHRGINIPGHIALVAFDDSIEACGAGLSSYNYNIPAHIHTMLEHLLTTHRSRSIQKVTMPSGMVIQRSST